MQNNNKQLLEKPLWSLEDIMHYADVGMTTASKIRKQAIRLGGCVKAAPQKTHRDKVLQALGLNYKDEANKLRMLEQE